MRAAIRRGMIDAARAVVPVMDIQDLEFGIDTFGDITVEEGRRLSPAQTLRNVVEEGVLADQVGLHSIGLGEHHRLDYSISAPEVVGAAIAARTSNIRLGSSVVVLSSDDPVRVMERYSTLDALSGGRAELVVGRGSFIESFPLFGYDLGDYEALFEEKLAMLAHLRAGNGQAVDWDGTLTQSLEAQTVQPPVENGLLRTWVAVGGSPNSVVRAAKYGFPLFLAIIGGPTDRFAPYAQLYRRALVEAGQEPQPVAFHSPGLVAETDAAAQAAMEAPYLQYMARLGAERGWGGVDSAHFRHEVESGSLFVGAPETVARKIVDGMKALGATRFHMKVGNGDLSHRDIMRSIELYGTRVVPLVREMAAAEIADWPA